MEYITSPAYNVPTIKIARPGSTKPNSTAVAPLSLVKNVF
jgi:hypothetical protein